MQACINERPGEGIGEVVGGLREVMEAEALQLNAEVQALHNLKVNLQAWTSQCHVHLICYPSLQLQQNACSDSCCLSCRVL